MSLPPIRKFAKAKYGGKKLSRQRRWQLVRIRDGKCKICGQKADSTAVGLCVKHWQAEKDSRKRREKATREERRARCVKEGKPIYGAAKAERDKKARKRAKLEESFLTEAEAGPTKHTSLL